MTAKKKDATTMIEGPGDRSRKECHSAANAAASELVATVLRDGCYTHAAKSHVMTRAGVDETTAESAILDLVDAILEDIDPHHAEKIQAASATDSAEGGK